MKKVIIVIIILIIIGSGYYYFHQKNVKECKKECIYYSETLGEGRIYNIKKGWNYGSRVFETQEQCVEYCLINQ